MKKLKPTSKLKLVFQELD